MRLIFKFSADIISREIFNIDPLKTKNTREREREREREKKKEG